MSITAYVGAILLGGILSQCIPATYLFTSLFALLASILIANNLVCLLIYKINCPKYRLIIDTMQSNKPTRDVYELDHAVLNIQPPATMWLNMGYWKVIHYY